MDIGKYIAFFLVSTIKFMFAPFGGPASRLTFIETYLSCVSGAIVSAAFFYFLSEFFLKRSHAKRIKLHKEATAKGIVLPVKKKFTRFNKFIIRTKRSLGIYGISMYAPFFFSVPLGSIVAAKFYGTDKRTFPLIIFGMFFNGAITTGIAYFFGYLF